MLALLVGVLLVGLPVVVVGPFVDEHAVINKNSPSMISIL
jgi:hypothetical protein